MINNQQPNTHISFSRSACHPEKSRLTLSWETSLIFHFGQMLVFLTLANDSEFLCASVDKCWKGGNWMRHPLNGSSVLLNEVDCCACGQGLLLVFWWMSFWKWIPYQSKCSSTSKDKKKRRYSLLDDCEFRLLTQIKGQLWVSSVRKIRIN